jgi:hypothetical protein
MMRAWRGPKWAALRLPSLAVVVALVHWLLLGNALSPQLLSVSPQGERTLSFTLLPAQPMGMAATQELVPRQDKPSPVESTTGQSSQQPPPAERPQAPWSANFEQRDAQVSLDYQLANIQGSVVQIGKLTLGLTVQGQKYHASARWTAGDARGESASDGVVEGILRPRYFVHDSEASSRLEVAGTNQDQLSIVWNLRALALPSMAQTPQPAAPVWSIPVQLGDAVRTMNFTFERIDELQLPAGRFRASKVIGTVNAQDLTRISIWYAVDFDYVPVRIEKRDASGRIQDAKIATVLERNLAAQ